MFTITLYLTAALWLVFNIINAALLPVLLHEHVYLKYSFMHLCYRMPEKHGVICYGAVGMLRLQHY